MYACRTAQRKLSKIILQISNSVKTVTTLEIVQDFEGRNYLVQDGDVIEFKIGV